MIEFKTNLRKKLIGFSFILFFAGCRSLEIINSQWLTVPIDRQGQMEDFARNITSHLYENGLLAGVGNDEKYLYILFSPDIRHHVRPPSRASLTLWLDNGGNRARKYGFFYTRAYFPDGRDGSLPGMTPGPAERKNRGESKPPAPDESLLQVTDKPAKKQLFIPADGSQGPQIRFSSDWGDFVYSWRIPLTEIIKENFFGLAAKPGQAISIGLLWEIKTLRASSMEPDDRPGVGFGPGSDGPSGRGGGMRRGGPGPGADFLELPTNRKIWLKIILAQK
jgi:hypothetical protein